MHQHAQFFFHPIYSIACLLFLCHTQELVKIDRAILRIPNLAIHLQTASEREAFSFNKEDHLAPIIAMAVKKSLGGGGGGGGSTNAKNGGDTTANNSENHDNIEWMKHQEPLLVQLLASHLGVDEKNIVDFELNLFDVQRASLGGAHSEFLHSARLDNLASCFLSLKGLIEHVQHGGLEKDSDISMIAMFDHEEGKTLDCVHMNSSTRSLKHTLAHIL